MPTASVRLMWPFMEVNDELGFGRSEVSGLVGKENAALFEDPEGRVAWSFLQHVVRYSVVRTARPDLGVLAAARFAPGLFDLVEFAARSQPTMGGGIASLCRLLPLIIDSAECKVHVRAKMAVLEFRASDTCPCDPASTEFALAAIQIGARRFTGHGELVPHEARFRHARPTDTRSLEAVFGPRLVFDAESDCLVFPVEQLALPHLQADTALGASLQRLGESLIAALPQATSWRAQVSNHIAEQVARGNCSSDSVAKAMGMTARTLLRRLQEEGTSFRDELEAMRRVQSLALLRDSNLSATELAYLLDFRSVASFHRAFKRWTNMTPGDYRKKAREEHVR